MRLFVEFIRINPRQVFLNGDSSKIVLPCNLERFIYLIELNRIFHLMKLFEEFTN